MEKGPFVIPKISRLDYGRKGQFYTRAFFTKDDILAIYCYFKRRKQYFGLFNNRVGVIIVQARLLGRGGTSRA